MKTIILKELREQARWAALLCATIVVWGYVRLVMHESNALIQLAQVLEIMAPLSGLVLGIAQSVFETRPDNWAFVVHRPIRRGAIFLSKCIAGLILLYAAQLLPIALATAWAAHPGHAPMPFNARLTVWPLMMVLASTCWYFGGIVVTLRRARWYGSRLLPLGLALVAGAWVDWVPELWLVWLGLLVAVPCIAAAAWGAFVNGGNSTSSVVPRFGLAVSLLPACLLLALLVANVASEFDSVNEQSYYGVEPDGRHVVTHLRRDSAGSTFWITDVNGQPLPEYEGLEQDSPALQRKWLQYSAQLVDDRWIDWPGSRAWSGYRALAPRMVSVDGGYPAGYRAPVVAWFNVARRIIDLYDKRTYLLTGTVGPGGFAPAGVQPKGAFPDKPLNIIAQHRNHTFAFATAVYWLELDQQRVRPIFTAAPDDPVLSATDFQPDDAAPFAAIMTQHRLHLIDPTGAGRPGMSAPLEFDHGHYSGIGLMKLPASGHLLASVWAESDDDRSSAQFEYAADGTLLRRIEMPTLPMPSEQSRTLAALLGVGTPLAAVPVYRPWRIERLFHIHRHMGPYWRLYLSCMIGAAVASAIVTMALAYVFAFSFARGAMWMIVNALLGPAGVVILLSLTDVPVRLRCPGCGRPRVVSERLCRRCQSPHAQPERDGREIFEPCDPLPAMG